MLIMLLTVVGVIGAIVVTILLDWEFGISLLLFGIIVISVGITTALYKLRFFFTVLWRAYCSEVKFAKCPYCGMKNSGDPIFCARCGKVLPK